MATEPSGPAISPPTRLGLPPGGPGSLSTSGPRVLAIVVDLVASSLIAALFVTRSDLPGAAGHLPGSWSLLPLAVDYLVGLGLGGQTLGMHLTGVRVVAVDRSNRPGRTRPLQIVVRTVLLFLFIPAVVFDRDGRGFHDRISGTAVVRA